MLELGRNFDKKATGAKITSLMYENGYTIFSFADKMNVNRSTVDRWRAGTKTPSVEHLITMSDVFNVPVDDILVRRMSK